MVFPLDRFLDIRIAILLLAIDTLLAVSSDKVEDLDVFADQLQQGIGESVFRFSALDNLFLIAMLQYGSSVRRNLILCRFQRISVRVYKAKAELWRVVGIFTQQDGRSEEHTSE